MSKELELITKQDGVDSEFMSRIWVKMRHEHGNTMTGPISFFRGVARWESMGWNVESLEARSPKGAAS